MPHKTFEMPNQAPEMSSACSTALVSALQAVNDMDETQAEEIVKLLQEVSNYQCKSDEPIMDGKQREQLAKLFSEDNYRDTSLQYRIVQLNNIMQILGLEEHPIVSGFTKNLISLMCGGLPKILKPKILKMKMYDDKDSAVLLNRMKNTCPDMFAEGLRTNRKGTKYTNVDVLGTNGFLAEITMNTLKEKLQAGEIKVDGNELEISLLCGTHVNKEFKEDTKAENIVMQEVFDKVFHADEDGNATIQVGDKTITLHRTVAKCSKLIGRANTVDTVKKAESQRDGKKTDIRRMFITYQPFARRAEEDIKNYFKNAAADKVSDREVDMYCVGYDRLEKALEPPSQTQSSQSQSSASMPSTECPSDFNKLHFAFPLSEMARLVYTKAMAKLKALKANAQESANTNTTVNNTMKDGVNSPVKVEVDNPTIPHTTIAHTMAAGARRVMNCIIDACCPRRRGYVAIERDSANYEICPDNDSKDQHRTL